MKWLIRKITNGLGSVSQFLVGFGALGLFAVALFDSALVPLPGGPDAVLLLLAAAYPRWMLFYVAMATLGSTIGCVILYYIARRGGRAALDRFAPEKRERVRRWVDRYDVLSVLVASVLPPPFPLKLFIVTAGVFRLPIWRFAAAIAAGRAFRYTLVAYLAVRYGEQAKELLARYYPAVGLGFALLLIVGFVTRQVMKKKAVAA